MSEQMSDRTDRDDVGRSAAAGSTDEPAGNLTVEDDPQGTTDPADLAGRAARRTTASSNRRVTRAGHGGTRPTVARSSGRPGRGDRIRRLCEITRSDGWWSGSSSAQRVCQARDQRRRSAWPPPSRRAGAAALAPAAIGRCRRGDRRCGTGARRPAGFRGARAASAPRRARPCGVGTRTGHPVSAGGGGGSVPAPRRARDRCVRRRGAPAGDRSPRTGPLTASTCRRALAIRRVWSVPPSGEGGTFATPCRGDRYPA